MIFIHVCFYVIFFFKQKTAHEMRISDWSSDVCSSDLLSAFERLVAFRYLRARRQEGFISVVAWFSLLGIMLGVATLIIVMSVMTGFREALLSRILGLNGHVEVMAAQGALRQYDAFARR